MIVTMTIVHWTEVIKNQIYKSMVRVMMKEFEEARMGEEEIEDGGDLVVGSTNLRRKEEAATNLYEGEVTDENAYSDN